MGVLRQTWVLTKKNLLIVVLRHWFSTIFRALVLPIVYIFIISYVRNFFLPPSTYGFGEPRPIRNVSDAFGAQSGRDRVVFIHNNFTGGQIQSVIDDLSSTFSDAGADVRVAGSDTDLAGLCRSSLTGSSRCYGAVSLMSSPTEGGQQFWEYIAYVDFGLGLRLDVNSGEDDAQVFVLPLVHAVDSAIARANAQELPQTMLALPFTSLTLQEREDQVQSIFMSAMVRYLGLVVFIAVCGITFHLPGHVAREREIGMSSLIDIMNPSKRQWLSHAARILATNISFTIVYLPGILGVAGIIAGLIFYRTSAGMQVLFHVLACMSLATFSTFAASLFRRAQLSGITIVIASCLLAVLAQWAVPSVWIGVAVLSILFPPVNYVNYTIYVADWESDLQGASWFGPPPFSSISGVPGWYFYVAALVQMIAFPLLTLWSEKALYGTSSKMRDANNQTLNAPHAISLVGFTKTYSPSVWARVIPWKKAQPVHAVSDLTFAALRGQLVALLGRNGAGKSTTMAAITAQEKFTSGQIELDGGGGLGFCPQKNVLWSELTVLEHVRIFNQLKAGSHSDKRSALRSAISACDLAHKVNAKSKTLSGGQKRKLQLAMAFTGGSKVCCVDEASSGLDPVSRRKIWDILLSERGHRTILFTTHALDEADALADHIVMMEQGKLTMEGSAVELKQRYGGDYQITLHNWPEFELPVSIRVRRTVQGPAQVFYLGHPSEAGRFIEFLENKGIHDYEVNGPTIETVFFRQAQQDPEYINISPKDNRPDTPYTIGEDTEMRPFIARGSTECQPVALPEARKLSFLAQWWVLYRKRLTILPHSYLQYVFALVIPIVTAYLATSFLSGFRFLVCSPAALTDGPGTVEVSAVELFWNRDIPIGPTDRFSTQQLQNIFGFYGLSPTGLQQFATYDLWTDFIRTNYMRVSPGGLWLGNTSSSAPTIAYQADGGLYYAAATKTVSDSYLLNMAIFSSFSTFALPLPSSTGDSLQLIIYFGLAMAIIPGLFALYPSYERLRNIKALQYSNGVRPGPLWLAHLAFDAFFALVISVAALVIFTSVRADAWYSAPYLWPVFFFYALSSTLFSYMVSLFFQTQLGAFAFAAGYQAVTLLLYFFAYLLLLAFSQQDNLKSNLNAVQFTFGLITPSGNLMRALLLSLNQSQIVCDGQSYISPGSLAVYGGPICYLVLQTVGLYAFLVSYDSGHFLRLSPWLAGLTIGRRAKGSKAQDPEKSDLQSRVHTPPADVVAETTRTENSPDDALRVLHLSKKFGRGEPVVDDLTFGVKPGEVYASLGPNGAGKTTTISLIRGNLKPSKTSMAVSSPHRHSNSNGSSNSNIVINGHSLLSSSSSSFSSTPTSRSSALLSLGVCPQFDAIDLLTVSQHLAFYARAAGIPSRSLSLVVKHILAAVGLTSYARRQAATLSGGNKRKLSLAIAVVGNPKVLLLDEPSSGMDAVSKRVMWRALEAVRGILSTTTTTRPGENWEEEEMENKMGKRGTDAGAGARARASGMAMVITSHSMEEVAALADRVGIMRKRMLAVGTKRELIARFGDRWHVHLLLRRVVVAAAAGVEADRGERQREERVKRWIEQEIPGARIEREMLHGQVRFWVPRTQVESQRRRDWSRVGDVDDHHAAAAAAAAAAGSSKGRRGRGGLAEVFRILEAKKYELGIEYYSVVQTNLEDVFLNVVGQQEDD